MPTSIINTFIFHLVKFFFWHQLFFYIEIHSSYSGGDDVVNVNVFSYETNQTNVNRFTWASSFEICFWFLFVHFGNPTLTIYTDQPFSNLIVLILSAKGSMTNKIHFRSLNCILFSFKWNVYTSSCEFSGCRWTTFWERKTEREKEKCQWNSCNAWLN